jgi:hypothetical protein
MFKNYLDIFLAMITNYPTITGLARARQVTLVQHLNLD